MVDDLDDRLSRRLDASEAQESEPSPDDAQSVETSSSAGTDGKVQTSQNAQNVKKEWNVRSFYLDDDLDTELSTAFKRLDLSLSEAGAETDLKKTRHFYPLIVELGLERLERMDITDITERLELVE